MQLTAAVLVLLVVTACTGPTATPPILLKAGLTWMHIVPQSFDLVP